MAQDLAKLARDLKPYIVPWLTPSTVGSGASGGGMAAHELNGPYHTGQLAQSQAPWAATVASLNAHMANANAHHARQHALDSASDHSGQLPWGWLNKAGSSLGHLATRLYSDLTGAGTQLDVVGWSATGSVVGKLTPSADVSAGGGVSALLRSNAGALGALNITSVTDLSLTPAANLLLNPGGGIVRPVSPYEVNLGLINYKFLTLHAAELWVETLVAQNTMATIGGRILVGPTTTLIADLGTGATTIDVKHNNLLNGDRVYMEADGKVEFMAVISGATGISGGYRYSVTRNLDGSGANQWYAGDAVFDTGSGVGDGFIDIYSLRGVKAGTEYGPAIVGNMRTGTGYNAWAPRWALGQLNGIYGYGANTVGFAAGNPSATWVSADDANGFRVMDGGVARFQADASGNVILRGGTGVETIRLDSGGSSYFAGLMSLGPSGEIRQGDGTLGVDFTGLRIFRDGLIGRIAGYGNGTLHWHGSTDGRFYFGDGYGYLDVNGATLRLAANDATYQTRSAITFREFAGGAGVGSLGFRTNAGVYYFRVGFDGASSSTAALYGSAGATGKVLTLQPGSSASWQVNTNAGDTVGGIVGVADTIALTGALTLTGTAGISGVLTMTAAVPWINIGSSNVSTGDAALNVGQSRSGDGTATIRLIGDTYYTGYGMAFQRGAGQNANSSVLHRGTGALILSAVDAGQVRLMSGGSTRLTVAATGEVGISKTPAAGVALDINGTMQVSGDAAFGAKVIAVGLQATGDPGGFASRNTFTNVSQGISTGIGSVRMFGSSNVNNTGWIKIYVGTVAKWIPYWDN